MIYYFKRKSAKYNSSAYVCIYIYTYNYIYNYIYIYISLSSISPAIPIVSQEDEVIVDAPWRTVTHSLWDILKTNRNKTESHGLDDTQKLFKKKKRQQVEWSQENWNFMWAVFKTPLSFHEILVG